jgi:hypothetical protein
MIVTGESRRSGRKNLSKCNFVDHKSDTDWRRIISGASKGRVDVEA